MESSAVKNAITISGGLGEDLTFSNNSKGGSELSDGTGVIDIVGSQTQDDTTVDLDENPADFVETDSFNFDATNLAGVLSVLANQSAPAQSPNFVNDSITISDEGPELEMIELFGGEGTNTYDIVHEIINNKSSSNQNIVITGGSGSNTLVLDREVSSAAAPDSLTLSSAGELLNHNIVFYREATGTDTSVKLFGVNTIDVNMYGGTLYAGYLGSDGTETVVDVNGVESPDGDPNHIIIEPPDDLHNDNIIVGPGLSIQDPPTLTNYTITGLVAQDDVTIEPHGGLRVGQRYRGPRPLLPDLRRLVDVRGAPILSTSRFTHPISTRPSTPTRPATPSL